MNTYDLLWLACGFAISNAVAFLLGYSRGERNAMELTRLSLAQILAMAEEYVAAVRKRNQPRDEP